MSVKSLKYDKIVWHNVQELDEESLQWLKDEFKFHPLNLGDSQGDNEHPKIDYYRNYFFMVAHFSDIDRSHDVIHTREVDIFVGEKYLITIQKHKNKTLNKIFYRLNANLNARKKYMGKGTGYLLYRVLDEMYKKYTLVARHIYNRINEAESEIFENESTASIRQLANIRRMILKTRLLLNPQRIVMTSLQKASVNFFQPDLKDYYDDVRDYLDKMWSIADNQKDLIDGLFETNESMLSYKTNRVIKVLTVFSVSLLPLTLLTGIYGMNIDLPWTHNTLYVWSIFILLSIIILSFLWYFRNKDLL